MYEIEIGALFRAAGKSDLAKCKWLVRHGVSPCQQDAEGRTPLMVAIMQRGANWNHGLVKILKSSINLADSCGQTCLMRAVVGAGLSGGAPYGHRGNLGLVTRLVRLGADLFALNNSGRTALGVAMMEKSNQNIIDFLRREMLFRSAIDKVELLGYRPFFSHLGVLEWDDPVGEGPFPSEQIHSPRNKRMTRQRSARADAKLGVIVSKMERVFGLPEGSVLLSNPDGTIIRMDARVGTLRKRWE